MCEKSKRYNPEKIQKEGVQFVIPIYQRLFVWEEEQITTLLEDLWQAFERNSDRDYYIGIITLVETKDAYGLNQWEIVDGQQRLTFLTLFGLLSKTTQWKQFIFSDMDYTVLRISYTGRPNDEKNLLLLQGENTDACKNGHMRTFALCFEKFLHDKQYGYLPGFFHFVFTKTSFLLSQLPDTYTAVELNHYFERLNSTGRQLEPDEIVKGKHFPTVGTEWNALCDFSKKYSDGEESKTDDHMSETYSTLRKLLESNRVKSDSNSNLLKEPATDSQPVSSTRSILSLPVFLLHVLRLSRGEGKIAAINPRRLVETFNDQPWSDEGEISRFISCMKEYRLWLDKYIVHHTEDRLEFWDDKETAADDEDDQQTLVYLRQFQSMLTVSSNEQQEWVLEAYKAFKGSESGAAKDPSIEDFLCKLKEQDRMRRKIQDDGSFAEYLRYPIINRYWFWRLDYILWELVQNRQNANIPCFSGLEHKELEAIKAYRFRPNRSIEHLHPQTSEDSWGDDLHAFGNLAMISASFNSAQGNDGVETKFGRLKDQLNGGGKLESIKLLLMFKAADRNEGNWTKGVADEHGKDMIKLLVGYLSASSAPSGVNQP